MPEGHNRILLGPDTERGIKENQGEIQKKEKKREQEFSHTLLVFLIGGSVI